MSIRRLLHLACAAAISTSMFAHRALCQATTPLRVIRVTPTGDAAPFAEISVTFDRPVAGSLDRTVEASRVFHIEPQVPGTLEWRDPVTIRLRPKGPFAAGSTYTVTVNNDFRAMDGSALAEPYQFTFRAEGPRLIGFGPQVQNSFFRPDQRFQVVYSTPVDLQRVSGSVYLEFNRVCGGRIVRVHALSQRPVAADDRTELRYAGGWRRNPAIDSLRRVVTVVPDSALPRGCAGEVVAATESEVPVVHGYTRWSFATYGDFRADSLQCTDAPSCPVGPLRIWFSTPVRGSEVLRHVHLFPATAFRVRDTSFESHAWNLETKLKLHTSYAAIVDTTMRDMFGQRITGNPAVAYRTTGYAPSIKYPFGRLLVERAGFRTLAVQHVNVDTLVVTMAPVPDTVEPEILTRFAWSEDSVWQALTQGARVLRIPLRPAPDRPMVTGVRLPATNAMSRGSNTLFAVKISGRAGGRDTVTNGPVALVQITNLGVHARVGVREAVVWVTGVNDGLARSGAKVELHDASGKVLATAITDAQGIARLGGWKLPADSTSERDYWRHQIEGYVSVTLADDRALTAINRWDPDLSPWRFNVSDAPDDERLPLAGALFTERGIYRPGERVHAKAIVRDGSLGALRVPERGDSIRWIFYDRGEERSVLRQRTMALSSFGTSDETLDVAAGAAVGTYEVEVQVKRGKWRSVARTSYRVAEYRPPEFLVDLMTVPGTHMPGDRIGATVQARYLFGAPMGRAVVSWTARQEAVSPWELEIPGMDGWFVGQHGSWWEEWQESHPDEFASGTDTLDDRGQRELHVTLPPPNKGMASRVTLSAAVVDVNRQVVGTATSTIVHPAEFYVAVKPRGAQWFWKAGTPESLSVVTVRPDGGKMGSVDVAGSIVRREWHQVRRERDGISELVGEWVADTVGHCRVTTTAAAPAVCAFTPAAGGSYVVSFTASDSHGRKASTSLSRWAEGEGWVPWSDESQFKMDVIPDRTKYAVGDTATVMFASPFTNAEAWITVEREGLIEQRRMRLTSGSTILKFPITEAYAPNAYVSIIVVRGRNAKPGPLDDPGRPTMRVGYAQLRVTPEVKRLAVTIGPLQSDYRPGQTVRIPLKVREARGRSGGPRAEVTLWAVDEGVLALTGYKTPDPIDLIYRARGLGMRLASNMTAVAPQIPEGEKGKREPGGGGGAASSDLLRSRFQSTAFFLGSVITDAQGNAVATAKLPDNLTTFRVMAVAVTAGDRYGDGETKMLVTRPLLARQALPRFVRPADEFTAGAVINRRDGRAATVTVKATASGVTLQGDPQRTATLAQGRGVEVRFPFHTLPGDSATFRFDVTGSGDADAVKVTLPVRPDHHARSQTFAGVLYDTATIKLALPSGLDPDRSRLTLSLGTSPLATIRGMSRLLEVYPYDCSEQVVSEAVPLIALYRASRQSGETMSGDPRAEIARAVSVLSRRQRADGGIGYWSQTDWTTPWLSAYAGNVLLDARDVGIKVDTAVLSRLAAYLTRDLHAPQVLAASPIAYWYGSPFARYRERTSSVDFLSRFGRPDIPAENELLRSAALLGIEDKALLAEVLARRHQTDLARGLLAFAWSTLRVEGRRAVLPDTLRRSFYFDSRMRPLARILMATLAVDPRNALIGPLVEALAQAERTRRQDWQWNTQDYASAAMALAAYDAMHRSAGDRSVTLRVGDRVVVGGKQAKGSGSDSTIALSGLVSGGDDAPVLNVSLRAESGDSPIYYYLTVADVPRTAPVTPDDRGIQVERWYETYPEGKPVTTVAEGDIVRVRLRIKVPVTREFLVVEDPLPAGLEAIDLSLRTASAMPGPGVKSAGPEDEEQEENAPSLFGYYGWWDSGWWSPFDHHEKRDDRVVYSATVLWPGTFTASYLARATTPGTFIKPPAWSEEMYNPGVNGRSDGGTFVVTPKR